MDPKKQKYGNSGEMFEETIGDLYGAPEPPEEKEDEDKEEEKEKE